MAAPNRAEPIVPRDPYVAITQEMRSALEERWPNAQRLIWAWRLARDLDTLAALIRGEPVDPQRIHAEELRQAKRAQLITLVAPIDLFQDEAAA